MEECKGYKVAPPTLASTKPDVVNHPAHYNMGKIEVIDFILDQDLPYCLGNAVKYIARCRFKGKTIEDLQKAIWYINKFIDQVESKAEQPQ